MIRKIFFATLIGLSMYMHSQSVSQLEKHYTGQLDWDKTNASVTFTTSGSIDFSWKMGDGTNLKQDCKNHYWDVPKNIRTIIIKEDVTVTGAFHTYADIHIKGENRKTSIIYGTSIQTWTDVNNPLKVDLEEWYYSQIQVFDGSANIDNLTIKNPFSYFVRGFGPIVNMTSCDLIDNRGGHHNHSDGYCGGDGSLVEDCYFECGDDVFKVYFDYTVVNCTVNMITNSVPIQLGWGNYPDGTVCTFKNLKIYGTEGRQASDNAIICGREGKYRVCINIDGLEVNNPNAVFVKLFKKEMQLDGEITNAKINVKKYYGRNKGIDNLLICGSKTRKNYFNCEE